MIIIFTGLIEEIGKVINIENKNQGRKFTIKCDKIMEDINTGDSICTNGVCLTATEAGKGYFTADAMYETLDRSNLKRLKNGDSVNLERSLTLLKPLGGHMVTGDIDTEVRIVNIVPKGISVLYSFKIEKEYIKYIVKKGRICVDGVSLTIVDTEDDTFSISVIPHTLANITLGGKKSGDYVNIEVDMFAKYVEKILNHEKSSKITEEFLKTNGF